jgi:phenylacetate-CoA ligase
LFEECGFRPGQLSSLKELEALPTTDKSTLIRQNADIHSAYEFSRCFTAETSGTSGEALEFRKNEQWDSAVRAHVMRAYDWYGVKPWDRSGYLWGYDISPSEALKTRALDTLQNRFRLFSYDEQALRNFVQQLSSARYIGGYSSMIYEVAKRVVSMNVDVSGIRLVKGTSEMILDAYQEASVAAFGQRIVSEYGAAEAGLIAFECPNGSMHINAEDVIVEVDDSGEIIVTNLLSCSFPIIRYRLGDVVKLSEQSCDCGRTHPVLDEVLGRKGGSVVGKTQRYPALTLYYVFKNLAIHQALLFNYRVVQEHEGAATLYLEGEQDNQSKLAISAELAKYFSDDVEFDLRFVRELDRGGRKAQYFESLL